jgi:GST-like protein
MKRWFEAIRARPATVVAYAQVEKVNPQAGKPMSDEEKKVLFGQTAAVVR